MFTLANKSTNLYEHIAQLHRLSLLTDNYSLNDIVKGPSITLNEEFLIKKETLPSKFVGKVIISPLSPFQGPLSEELKLHTHELLKDILDDDILLTAYSEKYKISNTLHPSPQVNVSATETSTSTLHLTSSLTSSLTSTLPLPLTFVALWDSSNKTNINISLFEVLCKLIMQEKNITPENFNLVIFVINSHGTGTVKNFHTLKSLGTVNVIKELPFNLIVKLMLKCNNHILTGSLASTFIAKLLNNSDNSKTILTALPMLDDSTPDRGFVCFNVRRESTKYFDRVYFINLSEREDRKTHMEHQLACLNLSAGRVNAINGKDLKWELYYGIASKFWNKSAAAYCLSYQNAIIDAIKNNYDRVLIMDDDAVLNSNFYEVLNKAFKSLPEDWHMLYLAANHNAKSAPTEQSYISDSLYKLSGSLGSHAIIINKIAFNTILNFCSTPYGPLDVFFSIYQQVFPCYITYPGLAAQLPGKSDILNEIVDYSKDWKIDYINHVPYRKESTPFTPFKL